MLVETEGVSLGSVVGACDELGNPGCAVACEGGLPHAAAAALVSRVVALARVSCACACAAAPK